MKTVARLPLVLGFASATLAPSLASAHVRLVYPTPRYATPAMANSSTDIKAQPCGRANDSRTTDMSRITVLEPGQTIMVQFNETINHPGHYRIAFDDSGQDAFIPSPTMRSQVQTGPMFTLPVLVDNIADKVGGSYMVSVTMPNMECENCTLQLIQVMVTTDTWTATGADPDIYFTCADIVLRRAGGGGAGGGGPGGSGGASPGGAGGAPGGGQGGGAGQAQGGFGGAATGGFGGSSAGMATGGFATGGVGTGGIGTGGVATGGGSGVPQGGAAPGGAPAAGATAMPPPETGGEDPGCGCRTVPNRFGGHAFSAAALAVLGFVVRRRRGSRSSAV